MGRLGVEKSGSYITCIFATKSSSYESENATYRPCINPPTNLPNIRSYGAINLPCHGISWFLLSAKVPLGILRNVIQFAEASIEFPYRTRWHLVGRWLVKLITGLDIRININIVGVRNISHGILVAERIVYRRPTIVYIGGDGLVANMLLRNNIKVRVNEHVMSCLGMIGDVLVTSRVDVYILHCPKLEKYLHADLSTTRLGSFHEKEPYSRTAVSETILTIVRGNPLSRLLLYSSSATLDLLLLCLITETKCFSLECDFHENK
ncbi:uncharacterized protein BDR25DRAFT_361680 [Lindgomyces ingoldianus]|uniref:Uncharacterized protein n=1 Tax=Lindgomyces ingoldianus TaxID=673940 RepID=A0ACB6QBQ3_9PLEO|nr:uncharacterized protein BDR25DRAFT_361680 [Lindgomyces ingoldianus]KAF2464404.1 hypothetical protein BDR25DRAFT_361680 [Lindgomyces ingoldianus]